MHESKDDGLCFLLATVYFPSGVSFDFLKRGSCKGESVMYVLVRYCTWLNMCSKCHYLPSSGPLS